jgi:hypothetical protein
LVNTVGGPTAGLNFTFGPDAHAALGRSASRPQDIATATVARRVLREQIAIVPPLQA